MQITVKLADDQFEEIIKARRREALIISLIGVGLVTIVWALTMLLGWWLIVDVPFNWRIIWPAWYYEWLDR